jgi:DNA invertase Pin-like site-specific DNA recombinase
MADAINAVIYARISDKKQIGNFSIAAQIDITTEFVKSNGWQLKATYIDEAESGRHRDRPEFEKMIKNVLAGEADYIIVDKFDRFARDRETSLILKKLLRAKNKNVISVSEPLPENEALALLTEGIMETIAHFFSLNLATETAKGMLKAAKSGHMPYCPPLGYTRDLNGNVIEHPTHGPQISDAFKQFSTGNFTLTTWAKKAKTLGYFNSKGNPMAPSRWAAIFHNLNYTGLTKFREDYYKGNHPPLIDNNTFNTVNKILEQRNLASGGHGQRQKYLLSGLLVSSHLDRTMTGCTITNKGKKYRYYRASHNGQKHHAPAPIIESAVIEYLPHINIKNKEIVITSLKIDTAFIEGVLAVTNNAFKLYQTLDYKNKKILLKLIFKYSSIRVYTNNTIKKPIIKKEFFYDNKI